MPDEGPPPLMLPTRRLRPRLVGERRLEHPPEGFALPLHSAQLQLRGARMLGAEPLALDIVCLLGQPHSPMVARNAAVGGILLALRFIANHSILLPPDCSLSKRAT